MRIAAYSYHIFVKSAIYMIKFLNKAIKSIFKKIGYTIYPNTSSFNDFTQLNQALTYFNIDTVFDIGANVGQFATELREAGFKGKIVSFEPLSTAHQRLVLAADNDAHWLVHSQVAIGDIDGKAEINISARLTSSSLLDMLSSHTSSAPDSKYIGKEKISINRLDTIANTYLKSSKNLFIKIDTQGFEWQVLDGAVDTLKYAKGVLCEVSLIPLYDGQRLWLDIVERLAEEGFTFWAMQKAFVDESNGQQLQGNAIFFKI